MLKRICSLLVAGVVLLSAQTAGAVCQVQPVIMYGEDWCEPCHRAIDAFNAAHIQWVEYSATANGFSALPVFNIGGNILWGYNVEAINQALPAVFRDECE